MPPYEKTNPVKDSAAFLRCYTTEVEVSQSRSELLDMLDRYGASHFGYRIDGGHIRVSFTVPGSDGRDLPVEIPISVQNVKGRLLRLLSPDSPRGKKMSAQKRDKWTSDEHALRVAWRNLLQVVEAAFVGAALGGSTVEQVFYAHLIVEDDEGRKGRVEDYMAGLSVLTDGRLPSANSVKRLGAGGSGA